MGSDIDPSEGGSAACFAMFSFGLVYGYEEVISRFERHRQDLPLTATFPKGL